MLSLYLDNPFIGLFYLLSNYFRFEVKENRTFYGSHCFLTEQQCLFDNCCFLLTQYCWHKRFKSVFYWIAGGVVYWSIMAIADLIWGCRLLLRQKKRLKHTQKDPRPKLFFARLSRYNDPTFIEKNNSHLTTIPLRVTTWAPKTQKAMWIKLKFSRYKKKV